MSLTWRGEWGLLSPDRSLALLFIAVPEPKQVKNRVYLDLVSLEYRRDEEMQRVLALGASLIDDQRKPDGMGGSYSLTRRGTSSVSRAATRSELHKAAQGYSAGRTKAGQLLARVVPLGDGPGSAGVRRFPAVGAGPSWVAGR